MSWRLVARAQKVKAGSASKKAVLIALASFASDDGGKCFPGQGLLEEMTELSLDTIQRALRALEADGLISRSKRPQHRGQWSSWSYQISLPEVADQAAPCGSVEGDHAASSGSVTPSDQTAPCGPDHAAQSGSVGSDQAAPCGLTRPHHAASPGRKVRLYPSIEPKSEPSRAREPSGAVALGSLGEAVLKRIGPDQFRAWLSKAEFVGDVIDDIVTIGLPEVFLRNRVDQEFGHVLLECCRQVRPATRRVNIVVARAA